MTDEEVHVHVFLELTPDGEIIAPVSRNHGNKKEMPCDHIKG